jgi:general secretion pathway protein J
VRPSADARSRSHGSGSKAEQCGFTLVELLVAMAVLAVLASVSFRGLSSILDAEAHVQSETRRWNDVAVAIAHMSRDLSLAVPRTVRDNAGHVRAAIIIGSAPDGTQGQLQVTRLGDGDGASSQGDLRRIEYRLRAGTLEYLVWPAPDLAPGAAPSVSPVLENVAGLELRALGQDGTWSSAWPAGQQANTLPRALEARIELASGERITRLFPLR